MLLAGINCDTVCHVFYYYGAVLVANKRCGGKFEQHFITKKIKSVKDKTVICTPEQSEHISCNLHVFTQENKAKLMWRCTYLQHYVGEMNLY